MVERIVLFKLKNAHATESGRAEVALKSREVLPTLPGVVNVSVGIPADDESRAAWDIVLMVRFESEDAIPGYQDHPDHRAYVDEFMAPRVEVRKAWNFEIG